MRNIIIVDMQKGFMNESNNHLISKINDYLKINKFDNIFFTKCVNNTESPYQCILNWYDMNSEAEQEIVVNISSKAKVLTKNCYGISNDDLQMFKELGITEMEICGTDTDACCLAIAFNLFDNNIKPIILSDLCASSSRNKNIHYNALEIMKRQFGKNNIR